ncbi:MAG TPA: cysteine--tRNA ligase [Terriglobia bacterium]|nr:cysteine--tRNA ligase [Terriglobia bacterium]
MALRVYNTLSGRVEDFQPLAGNTVRIYTCGPTVYDYGHIGNYRTFVFQDTLRRYLKYRGYAVEQVMNLTDVDDKTIRNARAAGLPLREYTGKFIQAFQADRELLNFDPIEHFVRATDHISEMVSLIQTLEGKGYAYRSEGSVYFRVASFKDYGKLSKINLAGNRAGASDRVDADEYEKGDVRDFVLWKAAKEGEDFWETPLGPGRPGWHVECSAMAMKYLGPSFDIHSGGSDLIFPHHENEIAQSEAATGQPFARFWMHAEHLIVDGQKMSKSLGNFYTLRDLVKRGYKPSAVRYLLSSVSHRKPLNFTFDGLVQAENSLERLRNFRRRLSTEQFRSGHSPALAGRATRARAEFEAGLDDNLNTAEAFGSVFDLVRDGNTAMDQGGFYDGDRAAWLDVLERWEHVFPVLEADDHAKIQKFGLLHEGATASGGGGIPAQSGGPGDGAAATLILSEDGIESQIAAREAARRGRDFAAADRIRQQLFEAGVIIEDTKAGTRWKRK